MLYDMQWLDIALVFLLLAMLAYQYMLTRPNLKSMFTWADGIVFGVCVLISVAFCKDIVAYQAYLKIMSAFLVYFVGRLYYDRVLECDEALATSSYLVVYLNFIHRIFVFGTQLFQVDNAQGDFYFYDTDMAYAMLLAFIFIAMFARNSIFKLVTVVLVCPYMIIWSDAGIQIILFWVIVGVLLLYIVEVALHHRRLASAGLTALVIGLLLMVVFVYMPMITEDASATWSMFGQGGLLDVTHMESRYQEWRQVFEQVEPATAIQILFGRSINTILPLKSLYLKIYFSLGLVGMLLGAVFIMRTLYAATRVEDRKSFYIMVALAILMLGSGVTVNTMESTQMSWFVMLFAGMVISAEAAEQMERE